MTGVMKVTADVEAGGPIFDGRADGLLAQWANRTASELGQAGEAELRAFPMDSTGRARGGFQSNVHAMTDGPVSRIRGPMITGVTWSPWLEGTSKRNRSTGFGGYHLFRKTRLSLARKAAIAGQRIAREIAAAMGGD